MMCLTDDLVLAYVEGHREPDAEAHLSTCPACRRKVAAVASSLDGWEDEPSRYELEMRQLVARRLAGTRAIARTRFPMWVPIAAAAAVMVGLLAWIVTRPSGQPSDVARQPKPEIKRPEPKPEPKPEIKPEPKPEPRPEPRPEPKPEPEPRPEPPKPEPPKPEPEPEPRPEPKPEPPKPEPKPEPPKPRPEEPAEVAREATQPARIEVTSGTVRVFRKGAWVRTGARADIAEGERVKVDSDGAARIRLPDGGTLCLDNGTEVAFDRLALIPARLTLAAGELYVEGSERVTIRAGGNEFGGRSAALHVKGDRDNATVTVYAGEVRAKDETVAAGSQIVATKTKSETRRVGTTQLAGWVDTLQNVLFMDEFEGASLETAWDARQVNARMWDVKIDKGQLACRSSIEKGEHRAWTLWTKHGVKVTGPTSFEVHAAVDRTGSFMPHASLAIFDGERLVWRLDFACANGKDALFTAGGGEEKELRAANGTGQRAGVPRKIEFVVDAKQAALVLDGGLFWRGPHEQKELVGVVFGIGQGGRPDTRAVESRFERVRIGPVKK